ncbi:hypothetical protein V5P93_005652 [Actinokineospora auranticolor]|uniref:Uncharacterized protein n=1 Tax=Actinokineospora auranticolor TaxID=155976 RepID=A0A2S6GEX8_9PSEU|nr:hypothetical protein [Actinokineospora auranticolor]PPK63783.1 hypothetical protein CLV40_12423 [Actinokineospora auranticolor]
MTEEGAHQVYFGFSLDSNSNKHTMIARSFEGTNAADSWEENLRDHVRLMGMGHLTAPKSALSYLRFDGGLAAILRRFSTGYSEGRNNVHALVGNERVLTPTVAVGLADWPKWSTQAPSTRLRPITAGQLNSAVRLPSPDLLQHARNEILTVLTAMLAEPADRPVSVLGCPENSKLLLQWGLYLAARELMPERLWSFSTYEHRHVDGIPNLPEVVFLPMNPSSGIATRTIVDLTAPAPHPHQTAVDCVDAILDDRRRRPTPRPSAQGHENQPVKAREPRVNQGLRTERLDSVEALLRARTATELSNALDAAAREPDRERLRRELGPTEVDQVSASVEIYVRHELLAKLCQARYGPDLADLAHPDVLTEAAKLIEQCQSEQLGRLLVRSRPSELAWAMANRWPTPAPAPRVEPAPQAAPTPVAQVAQVVPAVRVVRWNGWVRRLAPTVAVLAVLSVVFLLGVLVGRPEAASGASSPTATSTPPPPTTTPTTPTQSATQQANPRPETPDPKTANGIATAVVPQGFVLFGFVRTERGYYPQAACDLDSPPNGWVCTREIQVEGKYSAEDKFVGHLVPLEEVNTLVIPNAPDPLPLAKLPKPIPLAKA